MDVKVFKTFLEVTKVRHFGRAAENLYLTQAAVSARIKQLENYFDVVLFNRDRNNIQLTPDGERLFEYAETMVATLEEAKQALSFDVKQKKHISVGGSVNVWDSYLQNELSTIVETFHNATFTVEMMMREPLNRALIERALDFAFILDPLKSEELVCRKVAEITLTLVSTDEQHEISHSQDGFSFEDKYVYVDWGSKFAQEHAIRHPKFVRPYLQVSTGQMALSFILNNSGGAAYLPLSMVEPLLKSKELFRIHGVADWPRPIYLCYRKNSLDTNMITQIERIIAGSTNN